MERIREMNSRRPLESALETVMRLSDSCDAISVRGGACMEERAGRSVRGGAKRRPEGC